MLKEDFLFELQKLKEYGTKHFYSFIESRGQIYGFQTKCNNRLGFYFQIVLQTLLIGDLLSVRRNRVAFKVKRSRLENSVQGLSLCLTNLCSSLI